MPGKTVCFFNSSKSWGGGEKWHHDNAIHLSKQGYKIHVFTNIKSELADKLKESNQVKLIRIKVSNYSFINPFRILQLRNYLRRINTSVIVVNLPSDLKLIGILSLFFKIPKTIYRRGSAIPIKNSFLNRFLFKNVVSGVIANSIATKNTILQNNPSLFPEDKINVIYNGINIQNVPSSPEKKESDHLKILLGHIGRFSKEKNQEFLIAVAFKLKENKIPFHMFLGGEGPDFDKIASLIDDYNLKNEVSLAGFIDNSIGFMNSIDIFLLPSIWEGFGYVTIEAMICQKPVIAFKTGSSPEIIKENSTGYLIEPNNLTDFVNKIVELKDKPDLRSSMGALGNQRVKEQFDIIKSYKDFELYINNL